MSSDNHLIEVHELSADYWNGNYWINVVSGVELSVNRAETFGLVGESGSGKTTTANALMGYCPAGCRYPTGSVSFAGTDMLNASRKDLQRIQGSKISFVPQDPTGALSPAMQIGDQIIETLKTHDFCKPGEDERERTLNLFAQTDLPIDVDFLKKYPHQLSGGQQQRVVIAMALACDPELVILDEPTTGLDVTTQAQILQLLVELRSRHGMAMFYVTHNLGVVAQICTRIGVMYAGQIVEVGSRRELFREPKHPYTQGLIASVPSLSAQAHEKGLLLKGILRREELPPGCRLAPRCQYATSRCYDEPQTLTTTADGRQIACWRWEDIPSFASMLEGAAVEAPRNRVQEQGILEWEPILKVTDLRAAYHSERTYFPPKRIPKLIVDGVSFEIPKGGTFGLVGESGSGKTTIARALNGFLAHTSGEARFDDNIDLTLPLNDRSGELLRSIQFVFQNPDASLNPRHRVSQIIGIPIEKFFGIKGDELKRTIENLLEDVRLDVSYYSRYPDELSGGERQRIAIARALAAKPKLLLCDEILSSLDVSVQANILQLLIDLQAKHSVTLLFISHDLTVVRSIAHRVGVMYRGSMCEVGGVSEVFSPPFHPYTHMLLGAVPEPDPDHVMLEKLGDSGLGLKEVVTSACPLAPRCLWKVGEICDDVEPPWQTMSETHQLRCHIPLDQLLERELGHWGVQARA